MSGGEVGVCIRPLCMERNTQVSALAAAERPTRGLPLIGEGQREVRGSERG